MILPLQPPKAHRGSSRLDSKRKINVPIPSLVKRHFMEERHRKPIFSGKVNRGAGAWRHQGVTRGDSAAMLPKVCCPTSGRAEESKKQPRGEKTETGTKSRRIH